MHSLVNEENYYNMEYIERIIYNFKCSQILKKEILIKFFWKEFCFIRVLYDCFKLIYAYLNEGDKIGERYSSLKMMIQAHLHVVFSQYLSLNVHHLNDSIYIWNCCNQARFSNKKIIMKCFAINIFAWFFTTPNSKNITETLRIVAIKKIWAGIPSYIIFLSSGQFFWSLTESMASKTFCVRIMKLFSLLMDVAISFVIESLSRAVVDFFVRTFKRHDGFTGA